MANGVLLWHTVSRTDTTWRWRESDPMAPYLATTTLGRFDLKTSSVDGVPSYVAVDTRMKKGRAVLAKLPAIVRYFSALYGPYPFDAVGAVVDNAPNVDYSLETQTKPIFAYMPDETTVAHETSHMWFGDSVTSPSGRTSGCTRASPPGRSGRGAATSITAARRLSSSGSTPRPPGTRVPEPPAGDPGVAADLFDDSVYERGAMTLQALRQKVGNATFLAILRAWARDHRYGNATTAQFIALAEQQSGMDLAAFFQAWLYQPGKPAAPRARGSGEARAPRARASAAPPAPVGRPPSGDHSRPRGGQAV